mmetsp:Transcript_5163/g.6878  ORF Transcript_5163/g.6878 Transcript_5163/m.6878 type:complete len:344 (+) Transcript_5163:749-1780(+)
MERFFARGSLSSTKRNKNEPENCWTSIKRMYDLTWKIYATKTDTAVPPFRSENALARHYKVMKERIMHRKVDTNFRTFFKEWKGIRDKYGIQTPDTCSGIRSDDSMEKKFRPDDLPKSRWSYQEEVFLVAAVMERFFQRGSLASSRGDNGASECWTSIKKFFDGLRHKYAETKGKRIKVLRSPQALARHFKVMKVRFNDSEGKETLKTFYDEWIHKYNVDGVLHKPGETVEQNPTDNGVAVKTEGSSISGKVGPATVPKVAQVMPGIAASNVIYWPQGTSAFPIQGGVMNIQPNFSLLQMMQTSNGSQPFLPYMKTLTSLASSQPASDSAKSSQGKPQVQTSS